MTVTREVSVGRQRVWDVLADGWTYSQWVVGNSRMRAVDEHWPAPGSRIRHSIGVWPLVVNDETFVEESIPLEKLVLHAKTGPAGAARIVMTLHDTSRGCRIEMSEYPVSGPSKILPNRLALLLVWPRNRECTWRLKALAERLTPDELDARDESRR